MRSTHFLRLNDKEEAIGIFKGEIYTFKRHWFNNRGQECQGANCQICKTDPENKPSFRFIRINFIVLKDEEWTAKAFEGGSELYDTLSILDQKFDLSKTLIEITRWGIKQKTKYDVLPILTK